MLLEAAESSSHRGAALTKQLLSFVRQEGPHLEVVNANECINETLASNRRARSVAGPRICSENVDPSSAISTCRKSGIL